MLYNKTFYGVLFYVLYPCFNHFILIGYGPSNDHSSKTKRIGTASVDATLTRPVLDMLTACTQEFGAGNAYNRAPARPEGRDSKAGTAPV